MPKQYEDLLLKEVKELLKKLPPNVRIRVYYDGMGKNKYTLNQIGENLEKLTKYVTEGFKRVDERIDRIDARLDYIVQANNLKDNK